MCPLSRWTVWLSSLALLCAGRATLSQNTAVTSQLADSTIPVSEPQIIPTKMPILPEDKCKKERHESVSVAVTIDQKGLPRQIYLLTANGTMADRLAMQAVAGDLFIPARQGGMPVTVARAVLVEMDTCTGKVKQDDGEKREQTWLASLPVQTIKPLPAGIPTEPNSKFYRVGGNVSAPVALFTPEAHFSDEARKARLQGECYISIIVDTNGIPRNPRVVKPLGKGLDEEAIKAVMQYRFKPALKNGSEPVPVMVTIAVNFRLG